VDKSLLPQAISEYLDRTFIREPEVLARLREETAKMPQHGMQLDADQAQLLSLLVGLTQAKTALEIGVFTGYSSIATASALPEGGKLIACDVSEEYTNVARRYWKEAGVDHKIDLRLGPALETLDQIAAEGLVFDFVFIDADKPNYPNYYERALQLTRPNALIALDNMLWSGRVANKDENDETTTIIRSLNQKIADDSRVQSLLIPLGDGLTIARKL
jgi:predicted O-methyltransferase YrrM